MTRWPDRSRRHHLRSVAISGLLFGVMGIATACGPSFDRYRLLLSQTAGAGARNCGLLERENPPGEAIVCARRALAAQEPFFVIFALQGIDSSIYRGLAVDASRTATFAQWDSDSYGGGGGPFTKPWIDQRTCSSPTVTDEPPFIHCD